MNEDLMSVIEQCTDFLRKSSHRYSATLMRATKDMRRYSGSFWDDDYKKQYRSGKNRLYLSLNNWNVMCNAIASPLSASPWHTELKNKEDEFKFVQEEIDKLEAKNDVKTALLDAFRKAVLTGYGFLVVSTDVDEFTGEPTITLESVKNLQSVALDPNVMTCNGSDAEEGAVVNYIGIRKARRLYGDDVAPFDYPASAPLLNLNGLDQWAVQPDQIAVVSYYVKEETGVHFYKICGNKIVQEAMLPIKYIPIIRIAGNEIYEDKGINFNGLIQQTMSLELGANIAYSTLIERCGRSVKASYLINVDAIDGLEKSLAQADRDDAMAVLWKGEHQPVPITESFQTGDLQSVITTTRTLMEDVIGVPLTGIPDGAPEKTATEILRQQTSKESNTANYYNNAFTACQMMSKIFIELLNGGQDLQFTLENGPSVVTRQMKARQELTALATVCPDELKPIIAKFFADTLEDDVGKDLSRNILANLPRDIVYLDDDQLDPGAVHQLEAMKATLDETMMQLDEQIQYNDELQKELDTAQISLMENREQRVLDWEKFRIQETNKMALETAKLEQQGEVDGTKLQLESAKLMAQAEKDAADAQNDTDKIYVEKLKAAGAVEKAYNEGDRNGYAEGVNDGVDAMADRE
jgi:hypothetical protein